MSNEDHRRLRPARVFDPGGIALHRAGILKWAIVCRRLAARDRIFPGPPEPIAIQPPCDSSTRVDNRRHARHAVSVNRRRLPLYLSRKSSRSCALQTPEYLCRRPLKIVPMFIHTQVRGFQQLHHRLLQLIVLAFLVAFRYDDRISARV